MGRLGQHDLTEDVGSQPLLSVVLLAGLLPIDRCQLEEPTLLPVRQENQQVSKISPRLDAVHLAARQQRHEHRIGLWPLVAAHEASVLPPARLPAQVQLRDVVGHPQPAVGQKRRKRHALVQRVADRLRDRRVVGHQQGLRRTPVEQARHQRRRLFSAEPAPASSVASSRWTVQCKTAHC